MKRLILLLSMMAVMMSGCASKTQLATSGIIEFLAQVQTNAHNEVEISLQLISPDRDFDVDLEFNAKMELIDQDNELRAEANMPQNPFCCLVCLNDDCTNTTTARTLMSHKSKTLKTDV